MKAILITKDGFIKVTSVPKYLPVWSIPKRALTNDVVFNDPTEYELAEGKPAYTRVDFYFVGQTPTGILIYEAKD